MKTKQRLEYLREQIQNETISYGEIAELQNLKNHIDNGDVELMEWAGVPENVDSNETLCELCQDTVAMETETVCSKCFLNEEE